jgi:hypothetical protein
MTEDQIEQYAIELMEERIILNIQNHTLSKLRDELLPKLMSGKVRVKV